MDILTPMAPLAASPAEQVTSFRYPPHFLYIEVVLFSLVSMLMIFAWIPALISIFMHGMVLASALRTAIFLNITAAALLLLFFFIKGELKATTYHLTDSELVKKTSTKVVTVPFSNITRLSLIKYPYGGGVLSVEGGVKTILVPLLLQSIDTFMEQLEVIGSQKATACSYDAGLWREIHKRSRLSQIIATRAQKLFSPMLSVCISMLPVNIFVGAFFWNMSIISLALWTVVGPLFPLIGYTIADVVIRHYLWRSGSERGAGNTCGVVDRITAWAGYGTLCCYLIVAMFYKTLVL